MLNNELPIVTVEDFNKATAQKWDTCSCLLAQTAIRLNSEGKLYISSFPACALTNHSYIAVNLMHEFDTLFAKTNPFLQNVVCSIEDALAKMQEFKAKLPITLTDYNTNSRY